MAKQKETSLQERIQLYLKACGHYCYKNHGDMTTEPGRPDIMACVSGLFVGIEVKVDDNVLSRHQGIQCRNIWKAGGIAIAVWSLEEVQTLLNVLKIYKNNEFKSSIREIIQQVGLDDGTGW